MPSHAPILALALSLLCSPAAAADARLLFTGDILLGRQVQRELAATGRSPWHRLQPLLAGADWLMGNFEGAVGAPEGCGNRPERLCFAARPEDLPWLRQAGFTALTLANNHAGDLGPEGPAATRAALARAGMMGIGFDQSPAFIDLNGVTMAVVALSLVPDGQQRPPALPGLELAQKLRLARRLAQLTVVSVHWGYELQDWPSPEQRQQARWLVEQGADLIVGHHPHLVQPPECLAGRPVFYSLGNHLFDQKYPAAKEGLLAECRLADGLLRCAGLRTVTPPRSSYPAPAGDAPAAFPEMAEGCAVPLREPPRLNGLTLRARSEMGDAAAGRVRLSAWRDGRRHWESAPLPLLGIDWGRLDGDESSPDSPPSELLLTLERRFSPIDGEQGVRPYVYSLDAKGLTARWRGSALAWPLLDARLLPGTPPLLCALHRGDSFLALDPENRERRSLAYRWNGFGFGALDDAAAQSACAESFGEELRDNGGH
jgi:hypothetical protein